MATRTSDSWPSRRPAVTRTDRRNFATLPRGRRLNDCRRLCSWCLQLVLKILHLAAESRLGHAQACRRMGKVQFLGHYYEVTEVS